MNIHGLALSTVLIVWASLVEVAIIARHLTPNSAPVWVTLLRRDKVCVCSIVQYRLD